VVAVGRNLVHDRVETARGAAHRSEVHRDFGGSVYGLLRV
jgi:hypothetical protein